MNIIEKLKSGKQYHFSSQIYEPQYNHIETIKISIVYELEKNLFIKKNSHDKHTSHEKFTIEDSLELTELELSKELENINPNFWGSGIWPGEFMDSIENIQKNIR